MPRARRATVAVRASAATVLGVLIGLGGLAAGVATAPPAQATTYRYWTYWSGERPGSPATWTFSSRGPASDVVADGTVLGWRFAVTSQAGSTRPRQAAGLAALCPALADPVAGRSRVALVIDYGTQADAPTGQTPPLSDSVRVECLSLASGDRVTGVLVLDAAGVALRTENGLVCALDSYPRRECAPVVSSTRPSAAASRTPTRTASAGPSTSTAERSTTPTTSKARSGSTAAATSAPAPAQPVSASPTSAAAAVPATPSLTPAATAEEMLPALSGSPASADVSSNGAAGFVAGTALVAGIGAAAWWTSRRRGAP